MFEEFAQDSNENSIKIGKFDSPFLMDFGDFVPPVDLENPNPEERASPHLETLEALTALKP